jgi:hypothetical protein
MSEFTIQRLIAVLALSAAAGICHGHICAVGSGGTLGEPGSADTACGTGTLAAVTTGFENTAAGYYALAGDTTGYGNNAFGGSSLYTNSTGYENNAFGHGALFSNTSGSVNTALGGAAMYYNTIGASNTAIGREALFKNNSGSNNVAAGAYALDSNTTGAGNNAQGFQAMYSNTTGSNNSAIGQGALYANTTGFGNNAVGLSALEVMTTGIRNTAVGNNAGLNLTSGNYNTYIGWGVNGSTGVSAASESYVTRIGVTYQDPDVNGSPTTFISGIYNVAVDGQAVVVSSTGQLGVASVSSERFKTDIAEMGASTGKLGQLRPVTFKLKTDAKGTVRYGLIAEEVAKVYPELVIRDENGRIDGVHYDELAPMLLNEVQQQAAKIASLERQLAEIRTALARTPGQDRTVAQRH